MADRLTRTAAKRAQVDILAHRGRRSHRHLHGCYQRTVRKGRDRDIPMFSGQSAGLGTRAGDQQYVTGTPKVSVKQGPSLKGIGSRSMVSLHALMISPSLSAISTLAPLGNSSKLTLAKSSTQPVNKTHNSQPSPTYHSHWPSDSQAGDRTLSCSSTAS